MAQLGSETAADPDNRCRHRLARCRPTRSGPGRRSHPPRCRRRGRGSPTRALRYCYYRAVQGQRSVSRREVLKYACAAPVFLTLGTLVGTLDGRTASAANIRLIDFAERIIPPDVIKSAGYGGVVVYVSESRPGANFEAKPITREYADALRTAGLEIVSNYQYGKPGWSAPSDYTRGYDGGVADGQTALQLHGAAGGPNWRRTSLLSARDTAAT